MYIEVIVSGCFMLQMFKVTWFVVPSLFSRAFKLTDVFIWSDSKKGMGYKVFNIHHQNLQM